MRRGATVRGMGLAQRMRIAAVAALALCLLTFSVAGASGAIQLEPPDLLGRVLSAVGSILLVLRVLVAALTVRALWQSRDCAEAI